jgi:hypothetical protein
MGGHLESGGSAEENHTNKMNKRSESASVRTDDIREDGEVLEELGSVNAHADHDHEHLPLPPPPPDAVAPANVSIHLPTPYTTPSSTPHPAPEPNLKTAIHAAAHVHDEKDTSLANLGMLTQEREHSGPSINDSPALKVLFAKIDASDEEDSSDSDMASSRKPESISIEHGSKEAGRLARRFTDDEDASDRNGRRESISIQHGSLEVGRLARRFTPKMKGGEGEKLKGVEE